MEVVAMAAERAVAMAAAEKEAVWEAALGATGVEARLEEAKAEEV